MSTISLELGKPDLVATQRRGWRKYLLSAVGATIVIVALALGLGLGLGLHKPTDEDSSNSTSTETSGSTSAPTSAGPSWQPTVGATFDYQLSVVPTSHDTHGLSVWFIDLWSANRSVINGLQGNGAKVVCYFSAGSSEDWRPDFNQFQASDIGNDLRGWKGERWLNTRSDTVRSVMKARLDQAVSKQCDGVDPDNMDAYDNNGGGFGLSTNDASDFAKFLAQEAKSRNLAIGLKNAAKIIPNVIDLMQWSVNEQCVALKECNMYSPFIKARKPVFNVEYPKGNETSNDDAVAADEQSQICNQQTNDNQGFTTILKNINLDRWIQFCNGTSVVLG